MWKSIVDGQELTFYLVGINNQNFIMADHQTGTWWQQVTGEAIRGSLTWSEHPQIGVTGAPVHELESLLRGARPGDNCSTGLSSSLLPASFACTSSPTPS